MVGCTCRGCSSRDPRDKRLRVSALVRSERTSILIDTSIDFRQQMLTHDIRHIDAVFYTHHHYDHIGGFDDLRGFQFLRKPSPKCFALIETATHIKQTFPYAFGAATQAGGGLPNVPLEVINDQP